MTIIVTGDRNWTNRQMIESALRSYMPDAVVQGGAKGADTLANAVCLELQIPVKTVMARWKEYGRAAGPIRNREMLTYAPNIVLAFHNDILHSKGTRDMCRASIKAGIRVMLYSEEYPTGRVYR